MTDVTRPRVLVVEADEAFNEWVATQLRREGFGAYLTRDGTEALAVFDDIRPDLVLLDAELPGLSGPEVCQVLRRRSTVPIVMISVVVSAADPADCLDLGADDYVTSPYRMRELMARLRRRSAPVRSGAR